ncbi:MAG: right-handed parallel beta-helix repeat-containing protein [Bacteroidota bacterium]
MILKKGFRREQQKQQLRTQLSALLASAILVAAFVLLLGQSEISGRKKVRKEPLPTYLSEHQLPPEKAAFQTLDLNIDVKGRQKLDEKSRQAGREGLLQTDEDSWVKAALNDGQSWQPIKLRLKGDWLDHLQKKKRSYRIQLNDEATWFGMKTFSIQTPKSRDFLNEWFFHQWLRREDVLATRYDFIRLRLNGKDQGIYAFEEHFEKQLPESSYRREGPILRFMEDRMWSAKRNDLREKIEVGLTEEYVHTFQNSPVGTFREGRAIKDPLLKRQVEMGQSLMQQYQFGEKGTSEIFDLERLAKFYAILDVTRAYHSIVWHNQRMYFNPVIQKLEPIGFDGYTSNGPMEWVNRVFFGYALNPRLGGFRNGLSSRLFADQAFMAAYVHYLDRYSKPRALYKFLEDIEPALKEREELIQEEFPDYTFDREFFMGHAWKIHSLIRPLEKGSIQVRTQGKQGGQLDLRIANAHVLPVEIIGAGKEATKADYVLEEALFLFADDPDAAPDYQAVQVPEGMQYVFFKLPGLDSVYTEPISAWAMPAAEIPAQRLFPNDQLMDHPALEVKGEEIWIDPKGKAIDEMLVIPAAYRVLIKAGVEIDFVKGGGLMSRSPVSIIGTEDLPIVIKSSDRSARAFSVLQAEGQSYLRYVQFDGLNEFRQDGWRLTGAVNFYESDVQISHARFDNGQGEDGLNIVRSEFSLENSLIQHTFADGLDVDFCQGKISGCRFENIGNDGIDFSGSVVKLVSCDVSRVGDKGVSVGEQSEIEIASIGIFHAPIAIASKDLSRLYIKNIWLDDCRVGFAAFRKKPEFGPATIEVDKAEAKSVDALHRIEKGSVLRLEGEEVRGI